MWGVITWLESPFIKSRNYFARCHRMRAKWTSWSGTSLLQISHKTITLVFGIEDWIFFFNDGFLSYHNGLQKNLFSRPTFYMYFFPYPRINIRLLCYWLNLSRNTKGETLFTSKHVPMTTLYTFSASFSSTLVSDFLYCTRCCLL